ncbi:hypothetical protein IFM89_037811 [Coptis chinensis]|uniref:MORF/ORRM1/DAG-like MORF domain-containing protein n=1 Tax=Coptis chinensis TaxID=261450 RepID=A0A835HE52_9MAGN|nr:hypothetical protein IFM89_037811 [Coptis chinensis]
MKTMIMTEHVGEFGNSTDSVRKFALYVNDPCLVDCAQTVDCKHWYIAMEKRGGIFASIRGKMYYYMWALGEVIGSREEAKKKIYRIVCENHFVGFGAEIEVEISNKLKGWIARGSSRSSKLLNK